MRWKAVVSYDGSRFNGWQKQINGLGIQSVIENALARIVKAPAAITASGRTDAGVHALGQVFHFDGPENISPSGWYNALNTLLPKDIRILSVEPAGPDFHARFSARKKRYDYVFTRDADNPFIDRYKTLIRKTDLDLMRKGAEVFKGTHDFTSFCHAKVEKEKDHVKTITRIDIVEEGKDIRLIFEGNGFLRYQVRMMTGALLALGRHQITLEQLENMLEARDKEACRYNAPAKGLYLVEVSY